MLAYRPSSFHGRTLVFQGYRRQDGIVHEWDFTQRYSCMEIPLAPGWLGSRGGKLRFPQMMCTHKCPPLLRGAAWGCVGLPASQGLLPGTLPGPLALGELRRGDEED